MSESPHRSFEAIRDSDLGRLAALAMADFDALFASGAKSAIYRDRLRLLCLCQGAARHFVFNDRGVQDFDVWGFFEAHPEMPFPCRRRGKVDFGTSRFGHNPEDVGFTGRRVDVIGRSISIDDFPRPTEAVVDYLQRRATTSASCLAQRPVVAIWPPSRQGLVIWKGDADQGWHGSVDV